MIYDAFDILKEQGVPSGNLHAEVYFLMQSDECRIVKEEVSFNNVINLRLKMEKESVKDLEKRLIEFAVKIVQLVEVLPSTFAGKAFANQLVRS